MEIPFEGQYNQQDFVRAYKTHRMASAASQMVYFGMWALIAYSLYTLISLVAQGRFQREGAIGYLPSILLFGLVIAYLIYQPNLSARRTMRNGQFKAPFVGQVGQEGLHIETVQGVSNVPWSGYSKFLDKGDFLMLYRQNNWFNLFPRRFFQSDEDWQAFKKLVGEKIGKQ